VDTLLTWLARTAHVFGAALWIGGYAALAFVLAPALARGAPEPIRRAAIRASRVLSYAGGLTVLAGLLLVGRTRGYAQVTAGGEWGGIVLSCLVLAVALLAVGDVGLRPALARVREGDQVGVDAVRRWSLVGLLVGATALALMTRALYARG
jgi:putative copper export protein